MAVNYQQRLRGQNLNADELKEGVGNLSNEHLALEYHMPAPAGAETGVTYELILEDTILFKEVLRRMNDAVVEEMAGANGGDSQPARTNILRCEDFFRNRDGKPVRKCTRKATHIGVPTYAGNSRAYDWHITCESHRSQVWNSDRCAWGRIEE